MPARSTARSAKRPKPPQFGDRRGYQMDPATATKALREVALDLAEGADIIMVKPALPYLDIIRRVRERFRRAAGGLQRLRRVQHGQGRGRARLDRRTGRGLESLLAIRRAGAGIVLTYWAKQAARWLAAK